MVKFSMRAYATVEIEHACPGCADAILSDNTVKGAELRIANVEQDISVSDWVAEELRFEGGETVLCEEHKDWYVDDDFMPDDEVSSEVWNTRSAENDGSPV